MSEITIETQKAAPIFPRIFAFIIDCITVGVACLVMGKILYPYFENSPFIFQCIGTLLCLFYFAAFNSQIGNGKTIGKILGKIRVKDLNGASIPFIHSLVRSSIFIIPFCFAGYLQTYSTQHLSLSLLVAFFQSIVFACFYLAIFNGNSQQSLHDLLSETQILRNAQSNIPHQSVWRIHYYIIALLTIVIFSVNLWGYFQSKAMSANDFRLISDDIKNAQVESRHTYIGEAESTNQVLILNVNHPDYLDDLDRAETLLEKINQQHAEVLTQYHITQLQFNFSYQFGLAKLSKTTLYDYKKTPKSSLSYIGESTGLNLGF